MNDQIYVFSIIEKFVKNYLKSSYEKSIGDLKMYKNYENISNEVDSYYKEKNYETFQQKIIQLTQNDINLQKFLIKMIQLKDASVVDYWMKMFGIEPEKQESNVPYSAKRKLSELGKNNLLLSDETVGKFKSLLLSFNSSN